MQFVRGSRAKDAPHEAQYVLRKALSHWIESDDVLISSAALENLDFFISLEDTWDFVSRTIAGFNAEGYHPLVVRIGSPEVYKHRPIFCIPLFHELGHFVDHHFKISEYSLIVNPPAARPEGSSGDVPTCRTAWSISLIFSVPAIVEKLLIYAYKR